MLKIKSLLLFLILTSCVKDVDFDQAENFNLSPVVASSIIYFNEAANTLFINDQGNEVLEVKDATVVSILNDDFVVKNLVKAAFTYKITNTIERAFQIRVDFLNSEEEVQHTFTLNTAASNANTAVVTDFTEVFENDDLERLKQTNKIVLTIQLAPSNNGSTINENTIGRLKFESKALFYLNINTGE